MNQLPRALEQNGDLWVPAPTKTLLFRALQDFRQALERTDGMDCARGIAAGMVDHSEQLRSLALVEQLLGLAPDARLPAIHEQLGEPTREQAIVSRNLLKMTPC